MKKIFIIFTIIIFFTAGCSKFNNLEIQNNIATEPPEEAIEPIVINDNDFYEFDNKGIGWGLKKVKHSKPEIPQSQIDTLNQYNAFYLDESNEKVLYLTFDEGYENGYTSMILDTLKDNNVPAGFFVTGPYAEKESELITRMIEEGHIVGNHTVHHPNLPKLQNASQMSDELLSLHSAIKEKYNYDMKYMRPPEGVYSERLLAVADKLRYKTIFWSFAYRDWNPKIQKGAFYAFEQVTPYLHNGAILLLHAVSKDNAEALDKIINYARNKGYVFKSLDNLK